MKKAQGVTVHQLVVKGQPVLLVSFPTPRASPALTLAEGEVAALLVLGKRNRDIAEARGTTLRTVNKQVESLYEKLGVNSRTQLALALRGSSLPAPHLAAEAAADDEGALADGARRAPRGQAARDVRHRALEAQRVGRAQGRR